MAELLKRRYDLMALKTELGHWTGGSGAQRDEARFTLQYKLDGRLQDGRTWVFPVSAISPVARLSSREAVGPGPRFDLPGDLLGDLREWLETRVEGKKPLWVHLVKPYGILRFVPWERLLGEALGVPILMLPDFIFPPPREAVAVLDVAICGSAPLGYESASVRMELLRMVKSIRNVEGRAVNLHVFTDKDIADDLSRIWASQGRLGRGLTVYGPEAVLPYLSPDPIVRRYDKADSLRSPWLLWMRDAMAGRCVDVVHFVCHGYLSRENGSLLFAQSPLERTERYLAGPVCALELAAFLTQVGAWSSVFTGLPDNHSEPGLRALADAIAQSRPGPIMMYSAQRDPSGAALADAYAFLYSLERTEAPASPALYIYCQPYLTLPPSMRMPASATGSASGSASGSATGSATGTPYFGGIPIPVHAVTHLIDKVGGFLRSLTTGMRSTDRTSPATASAYGGAASTGGSVDLRKMSEAVRALANEDVLRNDSQMRAVIQSVASAIAPARPPGQGKNLTSLVSSTERFVEQVQLRYQQLARDEIMETGGRGGEMKIVFDTMQKLRDAVAARDGKQAGQGTES